MTRVALAAAAVLLTAFPVPGLQEPGAGTTQPVDAQPQRRLSRAPTMATPPAGIIVSGDTLTANPRAYRAWLRKQVAAGLAELHKTTGELVESLGAPPVDSRKAEKHADRLVKVSHDVWSNLQMRQPTRERPKADPGARPRGIEAARDDARAARSLVREIGEGVLKEQQRSREVDAGLRISTLEKLERLERIGLQLRVDLKTR